MSPVSVVFIARNEADRIGDAIRSVAFADEVVVLDGGSTDGTPDVARALGARVEIADWAGHTAQKNRALDLARNDWVLSLDADERVDEELAADIAHALAAHPDCDGFRVRRLSWWMGAPLRHGTWYPDRRVRLVRKAAACWEGPDPHDHLVVKGAVRDLDGHLVHHPYRNVGEHLATIDRYTRTASQRLRARWWDVALRPPLHRAKALVLRSGWRDGARGLCVAWLGAVYVALKWTRAWVAEREAP